MSYTTAVKYNVREDVLKAWLEKTFGESQTATGRFNWSYEVCALTPSHPSPGFHKACVLRQWGQSVSDGHSSIWRVTAPREITDDERHQLKLDSLPKKAPTFGRRRSSD
ncbi:hypothetical protein CDV36_014086 [Fusarium kuroshium]|uniref:Uncharacterized protein n=1 Tax=Fusarium kuroshium TaxID=2010991 RepID=A0A3M2RIT7_9HYPO|nr:hypothetical protein CDV36_014086 [Fusarium kuroshium]